jgi:branched-subunit amino acid aminotransferase/4-amino-4-deoxychorismate lyase
VDDVIRMEIDGRGATAEQAQAYALAAYGHFTAMQVRDARARGMALHLARLSRSTAEMFGADLDEDLVRSRIRQALDGAGMRDASVRVMVFAPQDDQGPVTLMVTVRAPNTLSAKAQALMSVPYQRPVAHLKQIGGGFGQTYYRNRAQRAGFDDALLTGPDGTVSEGSIANIAFVADGIVVWPDAPVLDGITMQLLEAHLDHSRRAPVRLADLGSYDTALLASARGVLPVGRIDDHVFPQDRQHAVKAVQDAYESVPWDVI